MKPLIVLLSIFLIGVLIHKVSGKDIPSIKWMARLAMSCMLLFTGISHFVFAEAMSFMLPPWVPFTIPLVYLTGLFEILGAIGLLTKKHLRLSAIVLILFLLLVLPANIYAALNFINPITGTTDGHGPNYLFFRIPSQLFFILWIYLSSLKTDGRKQITSAKEHEINVKYKQEKYHGNNNKSL